VFSIYNSSQAIHEFPGYWIWICRHFSSDVCNCPTGSTIRPDTRVLFVDLPSRRHTFNETGLNSKKPDPHFAPPDSDHSDLPAFYGDACGPLPLVVGITGHRDLRAKDIPALEQILREFFRDLQTRHPSTPLLLLTALADGADRLGARIAQESGANLVVALPMPKDLYCLDFAGPESAKEFETLVAQCDHSFELPIMPGSTLEDIAHRGERRDMQYAQVGAYIARHSQILLALWDGVTRDLLGGTSQVIRYKLDGIPEPYAPKHSHLDAVESGPVFHVVTPRESNPELEERGIGNEQGFSDDRAFGDYAGTTRGRALSTHWRYPRGYESNEHAKKAYDDIFERMETFNHDAKRHSKAFKAAREQSKDYLLSRKRRGMLSATIEHTLSFYAIADTLAIYFQRRTIRTLRALLICVFSAALMLDLYAHGPEKEPVFMALYLLTFVASFSWYYFSRIKGYQSKYLDYRALAEGLRVQFYWQIAGLKESVADYYLRKQKSELDWIRYAVRTCQTPQGLDEGIPLNHRTTKHGISGEERRPFQEMIAEHWIEDQAKYFRKAATRDHDNLHKQERLVTIFFALGLVIAAVQLFLEPNGYMLLVIELAPVLAALLHAYVEKNALSAHTKQYERMAGLFHRAMVHMRELLASGAHKEAQEFIQEIGKEALIENGDWILTHRERPLEMPKGG
jgi:hypothetical protein